MIKVNEIFGPTIQGEGKSLGKEVLFLRLTLCNLDCWFCDTPYTWDFVNHSKEKEVHEMEVVAIYEQLKSLGVKALVVSGGEPLLQQKQLIPLLQLLKNDGWWIEVETNGTVTPNPAFEVLVDQFNCSPKLSNAKIEEKHRLKEKALTSLSQNPKTNFKFVISDQRDIDEVVSLVEKYKMKQVYLMCEGRTVEELTAKEDFVLKTARIHGFYYTQRFHIIKWGPKRGV